jgi:FAD/FMN-containing dehydrogenase
VIASKAENVPLFTAGRVGLGALGVVVEVELAVVKAFKLKRSVIPWDLNELGGSPAHTASSSPAVALIPPLPLVAALPSLNQKYERLQWYWTPNTPNATLLIREEVPL